MANIVSVCTSALNRLDLIQVCEFSKLPHNLPPSSLRAGLVPPSEPRNLTAIVISSSSVTLSWDPPSMLGDTVQHYLAVVGVLVDTSFPPENERSPLEEREILKRKKRVESGLPSLNDPPPQVFLTVNSITTNDTSLMFVELLPFTTYIFTVIAVNAAGVGPGASIIERTFEDGEGVHV